MNKLIISILIFYLAGFSRDVIAQILPEYKYADTVMEVSTKIIIEKKMENSYRERVEFDSGGKRIFLLRETYNKKWLPDFRVMFYYDEKGLLVKELYQIWNDTSWENERQSAFIYEYDSLGRKTTGFIKMYKDKQWTNHTQYFYAYDSTNRLKSENSKTFSNNIWQHASLTHYHYMEDNGSYEIQQSWDIKKQRWISRSKKEFKRDKSGNITEEIHFIYSEKGWYEDIKFIYKFNERGRLTSYTLVRNVDGWKEEERKIYIYNKKGVLTKSEVFHLGLTPETRPHVRSTYKFTQRKK